MTAKPSNHPDPTLLQRAAAVPWWAWVGLAVVCHVALRLLGDVDATGIVQYVVPALFLVTAVVAWRLRRADARAPQRSAAGVDVASMRWREFETLIGHAFELQGFHMNDAGSDAGVDLLMRKERQTYLVHCKTWRTDKVGIEAVQAAHAAMQARGAVGGFVLSSGRFSREATVAAGSLNIRLVDGPALQALLLQGREQAARAERLQRGSTPAPVPTPSPADPPSSAAVAGPSAFATTQPVVVPAPLSELALPCPLCGGDMKKRRAKRGVNAGLYFWGCVRHPDCRGTRRVRPG
jgi:restriction system protein